MHSRGCCVCGARGQRNENSDGSIVRSEILLRNTLDIFCCNRVDMFSELIDPPPAGADGFRLPHQHGMAKIRILFEDARCLNLVFGPLKLLLGRRFILQPHDLTLDGFFDPFDLRAGIHQ